MKYRLLSIFYYFVIFLGTTFPVISMPQKGDSDKAHTEKKPAKAQAAKTTKDDSADSADSADSSPVSFSLLNSYLVHVTPINPLEHKSTLIPGSIIQTSPIPGRNYKPKTLPESLRACLYFCINSYLPGLRYGQAGNLSQHDVEIRKYAVVIPFPSLKNKILNVYPTDVCVYGSVNLEETPGAILFVPTTGEEKRGSQQKHGSRSKQKEMKRNTDIIRYRGSLSSAIEKLFEKLNVPMIQMREVGRRTDPRLDEFYVGPHEIQKTIMSDTFFKEHPYVSYGVEDVAYTRGSVMPNFQFLHFLRLEFYQLYRKQKPTHLLPKKSYLSRYNARTYLALAQLAQRKITHYFEQNNLNDAAKDFSERYGPIIRETLANIEAYIDQNAGKQSFNNRVMDFQRIMLLVRGCDPEEAIAFLSQPIFDEAREEIMSLYWAFTSLDKDCFGVPYPEDSFPQFENSVNALRSKNRTWNWTLYLANLDNRLTQLGVSSNESILQRYVEVLDPIIPPQAKIPFLTEKKRERIDITFWSFRSNGKGCSFLEQKEKTEPMFTCPDDRDYWGL